MTVTGAVNVTLTRIAWPTPYIPPAVGDETLATPSGVSRTMPPRKDSVSMAGSARLTAWPVRLVIAPDRAPVP